MNCNICNDDKEVRHFSLYVFGSEGINLCLSCQILVCELLRKISNLVGRVKKVRQL